ncbi:TetR/AcrR family transcriptional regulator [Bosea sp. PAMC 26642]|uniref:TetR/AcrR family transcriptional regulator n=1 Tax=Bosea sp. (strain PAMC 26642) TaxID=1792307 RepID=UPI00076FF4F7|nr:TetR/AcrR family transcriptional regulator [Bosea sp. PAMC 26642]AMJ62734.1 transcriptional regulator [Bosea sp. PAMC 26642]
MSISEGRRSQKERSAETSARLMAATIDLLHDRGLSRTSTPEIASKAGVSRGALTHHFASREAIISASVSHMLARTTRDLHRFAEDFLERGGSSDEIVDYIWQMMSDRLFYVTMEYLPEARHNPDFRADLVPVVREFHAGLDAIWTALAARTGVDPDHARTVMNTTMCLVRGMIAQTVLRSDPLYYDQMLTFWKQQVRQHFPAQMERSPALRQAGQGR